MRVFYIFEMKSEFKSLYRGNESALFGMLKQLYYLNQEELIYGYNLFQQLTNRIDKEMLDHILFLKKFMRENNENFLDFHYKKYYNFSINDKILI